jgi:methionine aminotransferase
MRIDSKLPNVGTTIFTVMSGLASQVGAINLSQGFPNYDPSPELQSLVSRHMASGANQYSPMPGLITLRERISEKMERLYGCPLNPDTEITITAGGTQAIFCAIGAFVRPGDEVILIEPCYDSYRPSVETMGGIPVIYSLSAPDYRVNWQELKKLVSPARACCVSIPHRIRPAPYCGKRICGSSRISSGYRRHCDERRGV